MNVNSFKEHPILDVKVKNKYEKIFQDQKEGKYPVYKGTFTLGDLRSSVVVVLPTPDRSLEILSIKHGAAMAGTVNTSSLGIEYIIANVVSNPNIRNIIVYGKDGPSFHPGKSLLFLKEFGIDKNGFINNTEDKWGARITNIDDNIFQIFQKQILNIVDLIDEDDSITLSKAVHYCIQEPEGAYHFITKKGNEYILYDPGPLNHNPIYPPISQGIPGGIFDKVHNPFSSLIIADTISQAYNML